VVLTAQRIIDRLREEGVDLKAVGYALQREMSVQRASRILRKNEVQSAIEEYLADGGRDVTLKDVQYRENLHLVPGTTTLRVNGDRPASPGQRIFRLTAEVENEAPVQLEVHAAVHEWRTLPVAARPIVRGSVITEDDIKMARLNLSAVPDDAAGDKESLIGLEAERQVGYGEVFRLNKLIQPPVINSGSQVTLVYKSRLLTATASGIAMEAGQQGQEIKVRNSASKKTLTGTVLEPGLVGVK